MDYAIQLSAALNLPAAIKQAYVVLNPGRGTARAQSAQAGMLRLVLPAKAREEFPNVVAYESAVQGGLALGAGQVLTYSAKSERPQPVYAILRLANDQHFRHPIDARTLEAGSGQLVQGSFLDLIAGPRDYLLSLWKELDTRAKGPEQNLDSARRFFADLDRRTHPQLIDATHQQWPAILPENDLLATRLVTSSLMVALAEHLRERTIQRAGGLERSHLYAHLDTHVHFVSRLFLRLAQHYFPDKKGINFERFGQAFEQFALGELALTMPNGFVTTQPSSGYYVFFGELAMFCIANGLDSALWTELSRAMIRTQEPFFRVHAPESNALGSLGAYGIADYGPHTYKAASAVAYRSGGYLNQLRTEFDGLMIGQIAMRSSHYAQTYLPALF